MQRLSFVLYQIDEARRYLKGGRLEGLRLALLLLDNAAELQLDRRVREEMVIEEWNENTRTLALLIPAAERPNLLQELVAWTPLSAREKRSLERTYDRKLDFLSSRRSLIDPRLAGVLGYLHRYRNEAYHEGRVRQGTLRTACLILIEANCQLLEALPTMVRYASDESYDWLTERFGSDRAAFFGGGRFAVSTFRAGLFPEPSAVAGALADHVSSRLDEVREDLDFIVDGSRLASREEAFGASQLLAAVKSGDAPPDLPLEQFRPNWTTADIEALVQTNDGLRRVVSPLDAFAAFSELEANLEAFERPIDGLVELIDRHIQQEIDLARGK